MRSKQLTMAGLVFFAALMAAFSMFKIGQEQKQHKIQEGIARKIIRFHVIADSDSEEDQNLKLKVKENVVNALQEILADANNVETARKLIEEHIPKIEAVAKETLHSLGCEKEVHAGLTNCYFPVKQYGDFTFPDGEYEALRVTIGSGQGKNWWCVMYPKLCFVDSLYGVVPETSKKELKSQLTEEEYEEILQGKKKVKVKWKFLELLGF